MDLPSGKNGGFINISLDFLTQDKTYRQADTAESI